MSTKLGVRLTVIDRMPSDDEDMEALLWRTGLTALLPILAPRTGLTALSSLVVPHGASVSGSAESEPLALRVDGSVYSTCVERPSLLEALDDIDDIVKTLLRRRSRKP